MGIDLKAMASFFREKRGEVLPTATLRFERDSALFAGLAERARPLPEGLRVGSYEDAGLTFTAVDRAGGPLTFITPPDLAGLPSPGEISPWNSAVLAFLRALPGDARIVLFWC
jgi:hypothetical protein